MTDHIDPIASADMRGIPGRSAAPDPAPIAAVVFDVEGVIAHPAAAEADRRLGERWPGLTDAEVQRTRNRPDLYPLWEALSTGRLAHDAYWAAILAALGMPAAPRDVDAMIAIQRATAWACLDADVLAWAPRLRRRGVGVALLSNSGPYHDDHLETFAGLYDVAHFSHRTGRRKPDRDAYAGVAAALGVAAAAIAFVDDKGRNIDAAEAAGMIGVPFESAAALRASLAALGLADRR